MARHIANNGEYFESTSVVVTAPPFTMACSFYADNSTATHTLMGVYTDGSNDHRHALVAAGATAGDPIQAQSRTTGFAAAVTSTGFSASVWQHAAGVWRTTSDRSAYLNGGSRGDDATVRNPTGMDRTRVAAQGVTTTQPLRGRIAEAAIWAVDLSDEEIAALAGGVNPLRIRPLSLAAYWPIYDDASLIRDLRGAAPLTVNGSSTVADHAPVSAPLLFGGWEGAFTAAAPAGGDLLLRMMNEGLYTGMAA